MTNPMIRATSGDMEPQELRRSIRHSDDADIRRRRAIEAVSLVGIAAMGIVSLFQTGAIRHLPDPPVRRPRFHSDKVNSSDEAYGYGSPDAPIAIAAHGVNMVLASSGPADRAERRPWVPLLAAAVAGAQARTAWRYLTYQMPKVDKAWCPYCVVDAVTMLATFALTLPEAGRAAKSLAAGDGTDAAGIERYRERAHEWDGEVDEDVVVDPNLTGDPSLGLARPHREYAGYGATAQGGPLR